MNEYAGIGARDTPDKVLGQMNLFAERAALAGWKLRSGGSYRGANYHFLHGATYAKCGAFDGDIIKPGQTWYNLHWLTEAQKYHPAWDECDNFTKSAHGRNTAIILGRDLKTPVRFVMCWTKNGKAVGGTGHGIRIAEAHGIPVYNLAMMDFGQIMRAFGLI